MNGPLEWMIFWWGFKWGIGVAGGIITAFVVLLLWYTSHYTMLRTPRRKP